MRAVKSHGQSIATNKLHTVGSGLTGDELQYWKACETGDLKIMRQHLESGVNVDVASKRDLEPLLLSILEGNVKMAKLILRFKPELNPQKRTSPIVIACMLYHHSKRGSRLKQMQIIEELIKHGLNLNEGDFAHQYALLIAIGYKELTLARYFLRNGADVNVRDKKGLDALMTAIIYDCPPVFLKELIRNGSRPNARVRQNASTPLHIASYMGRHEAVTVLLQAGADPLLYNTKNQTPMDLARGMHVKKIFADYVAKHPNRKPKHILPATLRYLMSILVKY